MSAGGDVLHQDLVVVLQFPDTALHHVADADQADQHVVADHRQVPNPTVGHRGHHRLDLVAGPAGVHRRRHDLAHRLVRQGAVVAMQQADDVPFGDDAVDVEAIGGDHSAPMERRANSATASPTVASPWMVATVDPLASRMSTMCTAPTPSEATSGDAAHLQCTNLSRPRLGVAAGDRDHERTGQTGSTRARTLRRRSCRTAARAGCSAMMAATASPAVWTRMDRAAASSAV